METTTHRHTWLNSLALLLTLPAVYFISISGLKYLFNIDGPFESSWPFLQQLGISENLGWNINLLILFGPLLAFVITFLQVFHFRWNFSQQQFDFHITIQKRWFPLLIAILSGTTLLTLFIYLVGENF
ncbi:MAG: hypothetical protein HZB42_08910 [Sphingobacteriales bacterium]|nr:hypothetical protein [Sphingobacteriales bacterium]